MKTVLVFITIILFSFTADIFAQKGFEYVSPKPNAQMVSKETNIIIRKGDVVDRSSLMNSADAIKVKGSKSGVHAGTLVLADDNKTILFIPKRPFTANETVSVNLQNGIRSSSGSNIGELSYNFKTTSLNNKIVLSERQKKAFAGDEFIAAQGISSEEAFLQGQLSKSLNVNDTLPSDFPKITVNTVDSPAPGYIFLTVSREVAGIGNYNMILDNSGKPLRYIKEGHYSYDFKVQQNNLLSYADISESHWYVGGGESTHKVLDSNLTVIDSFRCGNGYVADSHDFKLLPNGHALLFGYDLQPVDMSKIVEGGDPGALVAGSIIQEIDQQKNVVFEWRSWDYIPITETYRDITVSAFDYIHVNAIEPDFDGNLLISCRETSDIIKISRTTGEIIWRMGGKKNQFTFLNENSANAPDYFSLQHSVRRLENGNIILFDNGNFHKPAYSRAVEYRLDEQNKTAALVWEYRHSPDVFVSSRGSVQRLPNGNTLLGWGIYSETKNLAVTEVTLDKKVVFELSLPKGLSSYRAFRFPFGGYAPMAAFSLYDLLPLNLYSFNDSQTHTGVKVKFSSLNLGYNSLKVTRHNAGPVSPKFTGEAPVASPFRVVIEQEGIDVFKTDIRFDNSFLNNITDPQNVIVFLRKNEGEGTFEALPTSYDNINKEIISSASSFGEFIFGRPYPAHVSGIPLLVSPADKDSVNEKLPLEIRWSPKGYTSAFRLQVSNDPAFKRLLVDDSALTASIYDLKDLQANTKYYWRVQAKNSFGESSFSNAQMFFTIAPFIKVISPNGKENLQPGKDYFIRWQDNIQEYVKIKLYRNNSFYSTIADSVMSIGSFRFSIPSDFPSDSVFTVRVISLKDSSLYDISDDPFAIRNDLSSVEKVNVISEYGLEQNYPNPFNPSTNIRYALPFESMVEIKIFNSLGQLVETIVNGLQDKGVHEITWNAGTMSSGIYFYSINALSADGKNNLMSMKKMTLLK